MIVDRIEAADMDHVRPRPLRIQPHPPLAHRIAIGGRPPARVHLDADPLGPQRIERADLPLGIPQHLDIGVAVQQQLRRHRLQQHLPARSRRQQRHHVGRARHHRRTRHAFRDQLHRPLRDRIARIGLAHLRLIAARPFPQGHARAATRQRRPRTFAQPLPPEQPHVESPVMPFRQGRGHTPSLVIPAHAGIHGRGAANGYAPTPASRVHGSRPAPG